MNVSDLEPDIFLVQRVWGIRHNISEALSGRSAVLPKICAHIAYLQALLVFRLLFVDYAESEIDFVGFLEVGLHAHDLGKCLFCVFQGAISIVQDTNAIPQLGFLQTVLVFIAYVLVAVSAHLGILQVIQGLLVCTVRFLKVVHHQVTMS